MTLRLDIQRILQDAIQLDLRSLESRSAHLNYKVWEHKTLNIHRGVIFLQSTQLHDCQTLLKEVYAIVVDEFSSWLGWLRGFGFGVVVSARTFPSDAAQLAEFVDTYDRSRGVFQWLVYVADDPPQGFGLHMWAEGYLSPTYRRLIEGLQRNGIDCRSFARDKGAFFAFVEAIGELRVATFKTSD